jgi:hypothetical protein
VAVLLIAVSMLAVIIRIVLGNRSTPGAARTRAAQDTSAETTLVSTTVAQRQVSPRQDSHDRGRADGLRRRSCRSPVGRGRWPTLPGWLTRTRIRWSFTRHRTTQLASTSRPSLLSPRTFTRADLRLSSKWARASRYLRLSKLAGGPSLVRVVKASAARAKCASWKARQNTSIRSWVTKRKTNSGHSPLCFASDRFVARARS